MSKKENKKNELESLFPNLVDVVVKPIKDFITKQVAIPLEKIPDAISKHFKSVAGSMVQIAGLVVKEAGQLEKALDACASVRTHLQPKARAKSVAYARGAFKKTVKQIEEAAGYADQLAEINNLNLPKIKPCISGLAIIVDKLSFFLDKAIEVLPIGHFEFATALNNDLKVMANAAKGDKRVGIGSPVITISLVVLKFYKVSFEYMKEYCPNDLSFNASVLGEGGGTEICGHPAKIVPCTIVLVLNYIIIVLEAVEKINKKNN